MNSSAYHALPNLPVFDKRRQIERYLQQKYRKSPQGQARVDSVMEVRYQGDVPVVFEEPPSSVGAADLRKENVKKLTGRMSVNRARSTPFCESCIVSRPVYFTEEWMQQDLVHHSAEVKAYATTLAQFTRSKKGPSYERQEIAGLILYGDRLVTLAKPISTIRAPPTSVKVQWRVSRYAPVVALVKLSCTSALCVFQTMEGAYRLVSSFESLQTSKLLIVTWWYPKFSCQKTRGAVKVDDQSVFMWLKATCKDVLIAAPTTETLRVESQIKRTGRCRPFFTRPDTSPINFKAGQRIGYYYTSESTPAYHEIGKLQIFPPELSARNTNFSHPKVERMPNGDTDQE